MRRRISLPIWMLGTLFVLLLLMLLVLRVLTTELGIPRPSSFLR